MIDPHKIDREYEFTPNHFNEFRELIRNYAGIDLNEHKGDLVYSRLSRRIRSLNIASFDDYIEQLKTGELEEWEQFVNAMTTNLTYFYREKHHFDFLTEYFKKNQKKSYTIWCSAASTGEEPYSIAMTAIDALDTKKVAVKILASDLDTSVLNIAAKGIYSIDKIKDLPQDSVKKFFLKGVSHQDKVIIKPFVKELIEFKKINLTQSEFSFEHKVDILFCRNVMIYFNKKTQYDVLRKFSHVMNPGAFLFSGHSESFPEAKDQFSLVGNTIYQYIGA